MEVETVSEVDEAHGLAPTVGEVMAELHGEKCLKIAGGKTQLSANETNRMATRSIIFY